MYLNELERIGIKGVITIKYMFKTIFKAAHVPTIVFSLMITAGYLSIDWLHLHFITFYLVGLRNLFLAYHRETTPSSQTAFYSCFYFMLCNSSSWLSMLHMSNNKRFCCTLSYVYKGSLIKHFTQTIPCRIY